MGLSGRDSHARRTAARWLAASALAGVAAAAVTLLGVSGMFVASAPRLINTAVEPLSLLLLPGLAVAIASAGAHDFSPVVAALVSFAFYFALTLWLLARRWRFRTGQAR